MRITCYVPWLFRIIKTTATTNLCYISCFFLHVRLDFCHPLHVNCRPVAGLCPDTYILSPYLGFIPASELLPLRISQSQTHLPRFFHSRLDYAPTCKYQTPTWVYSPFTISHKWIFTPYTVTTWRRWCSYRNSLHQSRWQQCGRSCTCFGRDSRWWSATSEDKTVQDSFQLHRDNVWVPQSVVCRPDLPRPRNAFQQTINNRFFFTCKGLQCR